MDDELRLRPEREVDDFRGGRVRHAPTPPVVRTPLRAVRSASARGSPARVAASAITAAAKSAARSPEATISPARHAAQYVRLFLSPSRAPAINRTKRFSTY